MSKTWSASERTDQSAAENIRVGVADAAVTDGNRRLVTSGLGSCVAIALHDGSGIGGLLHAMLPEAPQETEKPEKYVDTGIDSVLHHMAELGADETAIVAKLTGGSSMLDLGDATPVGAKNVDAAKRVLAAGGIDVVAEETGGESGRSVTFTPSTGVLQIKGVDAEVTDI